MSSITRKVIAQLAVGACLAGFTSGCGGSALSPTVPSAPTLAGTAPSGPINGPYTVSGVVTDSSGPIAGANVNAWVDQGSFGYSYMWAHGPLLSDGDGRYRMTGLPPNVRVWLQVYKDGYVQQCAAGPVTVQGDSVVNLALVSKANLTASITQSAAGFRSVSGTIVEVTSAGKQPVAGAFVDFEPIMDLPAATTFSDGAGRFALCGLPQDETVSIGAGSGGRVAYVNVPPGQTEGIEIVLQ